MFAVTKFKQEIKPVSETALGYSPRLLWLSPAAREKMQNFLELTGGNVQDWRELNGHMVTLISLLVIQILVIFAVGAAIVSQIAKLTSSVDAAVAAIGNSANQTPDADILAQAQRLDDVVAATQPAPPAPQPPVAE